MFLGVPHLLTDMRDVIYKKSCPLDTFELRVSSYSNSIFLNNLLKTGMTFLSKHIDKTSDDFDHVDKGCKIMFGYAERR